ncbi:MAG: FtsQ-type POTRA domain-containing protein [Terracidiphilus sp.]
MTTLTSSNRTRSQAWEDLAPAEPIARRARQSAPPAGRAPVVTPPASASRDEESSQTGEELKGAPRSGGSRFERPRNPSRNLWWRPASSAGRVLLLLAALTVLGGFGASAYLLKNYLDRDSRFRIAGTGNIEASGLTEVSRSEMLPVFGEDIGRNIFFVPLSERRRQLEQLPWVERATVMRILPDQIRVSVVERQPVAFALQPNGLTGLVDADGVLLSMPAAMMAQRHYSFPVVTGIKSSDSLPERRARMALYQRLLTDLDSGGQKISAQISDVDLTDSGDLRMRMQDDPVLLQLGQDHFLERYLSYKENIAGWRQQHPDLVSVDLRIERHAVLSMPVGTNVAQAAAAEENAAPADDAKPAVTPAAGLAGAKQASAPKAVSGKPQAKAKPVKGVNHAAGKASMKAKNSLKTAKVKFKDRRRAAVKRAALTSNQQRSAPIRPPATTAGMGQ